MLGLPEPINNCINKLQQLQTLGRRSAQRVTLDILQSDPELFSEIIISLGEMRSKVKFCNQCGFFAEGELCEICSNDRRDSYKICLVEKPTDVLNLEKTQIYNGLYHVINQLISPIDNIFVENTSLPDLIQKRLKSLLNSNQNNIELIIFFKAGFSADATTAYIKGKINELGWKDRITITKLAEGLPLYYNAESLDQATIIRALEDRKLI